MNEVLFIHRYVVFYKSLCSINRTLDQGQQLLFYAQFINLQFNLQKEPLKFSKHVPSPFLFARTVLLVMRGTIGNFQKVLFLLRRTRETLHETLHNIKFSIVFQMSMTLKYHAVLLRKKLHPIQGDKTVSGKLFLGHGALNKN